MAPPYEYLGAVPTTELVGTNQVRQAQSVSARAVPSGFTFTTTVALADFKQPNLGLILGTIAEALNDAGRIPGVDYVTVYDDIDGSGQITHKLTASVESESGLTTMEIHPPYGSLFDARFEAAVNAARSLMADNEAGG